VAKSYVLRALKILGLEEIVRLSQVLKVKPAMMKKAAGQELVSWSDASDQAEVNRAQESPPLATILPFKKELPRREQEESSTPSDPAQSTDAEIPNLVSSEFILWQRELTKDVSSPLMSKEAVKGYSKSTEMYVVKTPSADGTDKIRFASTKGVLVNKKQA
jgi:hypothetical protein